MQHYFVYVSGWRELRKWFLPGCECFFLQFFRDSNSIFLQISGRFHLPSNIVNYTEYKFLSFSTRKLIVFHSFLWFHLQFLDFSRSFNFFREFSKDFLVALQLCNLEFRALVGGPSTIENWGQFLKSLEPDNSLDKPYNWTPLKPKRPYNKLFKGSKDVFQCLMRQKKHYIPIFLLFITALTTFF